ncbi:hypothetical protein KP79_PYT13077 [Mizuhopecten yessoensis]|uniref:Uncharacterized protein n=1 Tax=Mizuhopecten yessoensis TaxID=6573 RepID=A0A210QFZ1_MIZYE|nr:hypothetical protein KP79_PYT13077 [Mizuhopecten yessoensis]
MSKVLLVAEFRHDIITVVQRRVAMVGISNITSVKILHPVTATVRTVMKPAVNAYPRNPQYNNMPQTNGPAPLVNVPGSGPPLNSGEMFVAGVVVGGGGMGMLPGPEMYNPMSGRGIKLTSAFTWKVTMYHLQINEL